MNLSKSTLNKATIFLFLFLHLVNCLPIEVYIVKNDGKKIVIYDQEAGQNNQFEKDVLMECTCSPSNYKQIQYGKDESNYILIKNIGTEAIELDSVKFYQNEVDDVKFSLEWDQNPSKKQQNNLENSPQYNIKDDSRIIQPNQSIQILQKVAFPKEFNEDNYWLTANLNFVFNNGDYHLDMYYIAVLDTNFKPKKFDWALLLLITLTCIMIYFFARFGQIYAYKTSFCGSQIQWWWGLIYSIGLTCVVILVHYSHETSVYVLDIVMSIVSLICCYFFACEVLALLCFSCRSINSTRMNKPAQSFFFKPVAYKIRGADMFGVLFSALSVSTWYFIKKPWFLNDLLSIAIMSCSIKLFKITCMKSAALFMGITLLYDTLTAILIHYSQSESYDSLILAKANYPFEIQIPSFKHILNKKCAWIAMTAIILPGFFLQYLHRFDKSRNSQVYAILGFLGLFIGSLMWVFATVWNIHTWPFACFTYPLIYLFVILFALKRGETAVLWNGEFYDPDLLTPLTLKKLQEEAEREEQKDEQEEIEEQEQYLSRLQMNNINNDSIHNTSNDESDRIIYSKSYNVSAIRKTKVNIDASLFHGLTMAEKESIDGGPQDDNVITQCAQIHQLNQQNQNNK